MNFAISWWNARSVGQIWSEAKEIGGAMRVLAISGYVMAIAGFTMVYGCILLILTIVLYPTVPFLYENLGLAQLTQVTSDLLYILVIFAVLPSGIVIWLHSLVVAWKRRTLSDGLIAGYNTFAMVRNVVGASRELPGAFNRLTKACFGSKGKKDANVMLAMVGVFIVALAVFGGWMTASAIMKRADREYDLIAQVQR